MCESYHLSHICYDVHNHTDTFKSIAILPLKLTNERICRYVVYKEVNLVKIVSLRLQINGVWLLAKDHAAFPIAACHIL